MLTRAVSGQSLLKPVALAFALACVAGTWPVAAFADPIGEGLTDSLNGHWREAIAKLEPLALAGNADASYALGQMYGGIGGPADDRRSLLWYQRAAAGGSPKGVIAVASRYASGDGVKKDVDHAIQLLAAGSVKDDPDVQFNLALILSDEKYDKHDYVRAYVLFTRAIDSRPDAPPGFRPVDLRKEVAGRMTVDQVAQAERMLSSQPKER